MPARLAALASAAMPGVYAPAPGLDGEDARHRPFAIGRELDVADDGGEGRPVQLIGELIAIEAADRRHRLLQDLQGRIVKEGTNSS